MSEQTIYAQLVKAGLSPVGACAVMGNMKAESAMRANNAQDGMTKMSDADYTAAVDNGTYSNFVRDSVGYGLCQWTYYTRKQALLAYAQSKGVSIGDEAMQVDFTIKELKSDYPKLWEYLTAANGVYDAASRVCKEYERPAVNNVNVRADYANQYYMSLSSMSVNDNEVAAEKSSESSWPPRTLSYGTFGADVLAFQALLMAHGYSLGVDGQFGNKTKAMAMAFQAEHGLTPDGIAGPRTWEKLVEGAGK